MEVEITDIKIGKRARKDVGNIDALVASIEKVGLLHPVCLLPDNRLIVGYRRIAAFKKMGQTKIPATVCKTIGEALKRHAESDENVCRLDLSPSEMHTMAEWLRPQFKAESDAALEEGRKRGGKTGGKGRPKDSSVPKKHQANAMAKKTETKIAAAVGVSRSTLGKVAKVMASGDAKIIALMDETGKPEKAIRELNKKEEETKQEAAAKKAKQQTNVQYVWHVKMEDWLGDQSPAAIITDPPYGKDHLELYEKLAEQSKYLVANGTLLAVMIGHTYLPQILASMTKHVPYMWVIAYLCPGGQAASQWHVCVSTFWKPVLLFGLPKKKKWISDVCKSEVNDNDKRYHDWGQSESGMRELIEKLTEPGDLVVDPFCGAGTTGVACLALNRSFRGCDSDKASCKTAERRILAMYEEIHGQ